MPFAVDPPQALDSFAISQQQFDRCANLLNLDPGLRLVLREPVRELHVTLPVRMDDGSIRGVQGLPRAVQRRARTGQGRHPLPPGRDDQHRPRARGLDDVEDGRHGSAAGRRQGRNHLQPERAVGA